MTRRSTGRPHVPSAHDDGHDIAKYPFDRKADSATVNRAASTSKSKCLQKEKQKQKTE